jgi:succinate dehydrogenase hydrophobic anchor subunit
MKAKESLKRTTDQEGSALVMILIASTVVLIVIGALMSKSSNQHKATKSRQTNQDFRQAMTALYLTFSSPEICTGFFGKTTSSPGLPFIGGSIQVGAKVDVNGVKLDVPGRGALTKGAKLLGVTVDDVSITLTEPVGEADVQVSKLPNAPRQKWQVWVAHLAASVHNDNGVGIVKKDYRIPMIVFAFGGRIKGCNTNSSLLSYGAYFNPTAPTAASPKVELTTRPAKAIANVGGSESTKCTASEKLMAVSYRFLDAAGFRSGFSNVYPLASGVFGDPDGIKAAGGTTLKETPHVMVDADSPTPGCTALGGSQGNGVECLIFCAGLSKK